MLHLRLRSVLYLLTIFFAQGAITGCGSQSQNNPPNGQGPGDRPLGFVSKFNPNRSWSIDAMVFGGDGTWGVEVASIEAILANHGASFRQVGSAELNGMSLDDLSSFGLMIFPGGTGALEAGSLSPATHERLREAVRSRGVSYMGFCAGSFIAVSPEPSAGQDVSYGLGILAGPELQYYYLENVLNPDIAMVEAKFADGTARKLVWYGGPVTPQIQGGVIAKYPNGDPMISQSWSGNGFVILSAVHPAAPQSVRDEFGLNDEDGLDFDIAWNLISAALHQKILPAF